MKQTPEELAQYLRADWPAEEKHEYVLLVNTAAGICILHTVESDKVPEFIKYFHDVTGDKGEAT